MEEFNQSTTPNAYSWQPTESTRNGEYSGGAASLISSTNSQVQEEETNGGDGERRPDPPPQGTGVTPYNPYSMAADDDDFTVVSWMRDEAWSCIAVIFTFWFLVCMIMVMGVYGSVTLILGPHSSILIKPNSFFVDYVKIEELYEGTEGPILLYGFYKDPPLDVVIAWSDSHNVNLQSSAHKEWVYFLNEGSQMNISYSVTLNSSSFSSLIFVIANGYEDLSLWLEDPSNQNVTLSWQVIQGNGTIQRDIFTSSSYYVALGNLNEEAAVGQLNMRLKTLVYNTTNAYDKCSFTEEECSVKLPFGGGNTALLTSPGPKPGRAVNEWYVKLSYGPRWITYLAGIGGTSVLVLVAIHFLGYYCSCMDEISRVHIGGEILSSQRTPLLPNKDDDLSSWGSSYDCVSQGEEDPEDPQAATDGENNTRRLCAICFDAPRDCFFLPCGHCVACFTCGTRISEAAGTCPICRRPMKKVRKIFTV